MPVKVGTLLVDIGANVARLQTDMGKAGRELEKFRSATTRIFKALGAISGGIIASATINRIIEAGKQSLATADKIGKVADKLGLATESLQAYRFAASQSGVEQNALDMGLQRLTRRLAEAAQGKGELISTLQQYNVAIRDSAGGTRAAETVLGDLAEVIQRTQDPAERLRIAFKAFDSEGVALINMLRGGREGLEGFKEKAAAAGLILEERFIRSAERANDAMDILARQGQTKVTRMFAAMAPQIERLAVVLGSTTGVVDGLTASFSRFGGNVLGSVADVVNALNQIAAAFSDFKSKHPVLWDLVSGAWKMAPGPFTSLGWMSDTGGQPEQPPNDMRWLTPKSGLGRMTRPDNGGVVPPGPSGGGRGEDPARHLQEQIEKIRKEYETRKKLEQDLADSIIQIRGNWTDRVLADIAREQAAWSDRIKNTVASEEWKNAKLEDLRGLEAARMEEAAAEWIRMQEDFHAEVNAIQDNGYQQELLRIQRQGEEWEKLGNDIAEINEWAVEASLDAWAQYSDEAAAGAYRALDEFGKQSTNLANVFDSAVSTVFDGLTDSLMDFIKTGKFSFEDLVNSMIEDLLRLTLQAAILGPLANAISGGLAGLFSGSSGPNSGITPWQGQYRHGGGPAGSGPRVPMNPALFLGAPRLHDGLRPDEVPTILKAGEWVLSESDVSRIGRGGGGTEVNVYVDNSSGAQVDVQQQRGGNGSVDLNIKISEAVAADLNSGGPVSRMMKTRFGLRPQMAGR